jgi:hypothetical protein
VFLSLFSTSLFLVLEVSNLPPPRASPPAEAVDGGEPEPANMNGSEPPSAERRCKKLPEEKLRKIAQALVFLASARAVMESYIRDPDSYPPSPFLVATYIRTYAWLVGQIIELSKSHSCGESK